MLGNSAGVEAIGDTQSGWHRKRRMLKLHSPELLPLYPRSKTNKPGDGGRCRKSVGRPAEAVAWEVTAATKRSPHHDH